MKQLIIFTILFTSIHLNVFCQCPSYLYKELTLKEINKIQSKINIEDYDAARKILLEELDTNSNPELILLLIRCYFKTRDYDNLIYWEEQIARLPESDIRCANDYDINQKYLRYGKCREADSIKIMVYRCGDIPNWTGLKKHINLCKLIDTLENKNYGKYEIKGISSNSSYDDISPSFYGNKIAYLKTIRKPNLFKWKNYWKYEQEIMIHSSSSTKRITPKKRKMNYSSIHFSENNEFTFSSLSDTYSSNYNQKMITEVLHTTSYQKDKKISESNLQSFPCNSEDYRIKDAFISNDGKLIYFSSDMPGGFGGYDLYVAEKHLNRWEPPINLGPEINTEYDELSPSSDGNGYLYFSSDGYLGLGGLDIYKVFIKEEFNTYGEVTNIGAPFNSRDDDKDFIIRSDRDEGYFSSNREGGKGAYDIYHFLLK